MNSSLQVKDFASKIPSIFNIIIFPQALFCSNCFCKVLKDHKHGALLFDKGMDAI
jgi:hypothetical protein